MKIEFKKSELFFLIHLIEINEREEFYYGNKNQYFKRLLNTKQKLIKLKEKATN